MAGKKAFGAKFAYESAASTFTDIAHITSITPFEQSAETIETTAHDSPDMYKEFVVGALDAGSAKLELNYDPGAVTHTYLHTCFETAASENWKITFPVTPAKTATFAGIITGISAELPYNDKMTASVTIKITGKVTFA